MPRTRPPTSTSTARRRGRREHAPRTVSPASPIAEKLTSKRHYAAAVAQLDEPGLQGTAVELELDRKLLARGWWFDFAEAERVCAFFEKVLRHSKGEWAGQLVKLEAWQRRLLRRLFGWRREDGTRRYRRTQIWIPKKNGKSFLAAGIAMYLLVADGEPAAEIYCAAGNKEQAGMVFNECKAMAASPDLAEVTVFASSIFHQQSASKIQALSAKPGTKHGFNVHGIVVDEVHEFKSRDLYDFLTSGVGARRQPLEVVISTAGADIGSFGYELWELALKLRDGIFEDPETLVCVFAADPADPWDEPKTWAKANPNLGISPKLSFLQGEVRKAKGQPGFVAAFKRLYLNVWTQAKSAWIDLEKWKACPRCPTSIVPYRRRKCWGGLDLSKTTDLSALVLVFEPPEPDGPWDVKCFFWCPEDHARERAARDMVQYPLWIQQGWIRATPGDIVDYRAIREDIRRIAGVLDVQEIAYDRKYATELVQNLQDEDGITMVEFGQNIGQMSAPSMELERRYRGKLIRIPDNPVLTWMASNVAVYTDTSGNIKPIKPRPTARIDGIVALVMAIARATLGAGQRSVYEERGVQQV